MNTCGTCRFLGKPAEIWQEDDDGNEIACPYRICNLLKHLNASPPFDFSAPAGVEDGSGYHAALCVKEEFGCNQWQARDSSKSTGDT